MPKTTSNDWSRVMGEALLGNDFALFVDGLLVSEAHRDNDPWEMLDCTAGWEQW